MKKTTIVSLLSFAVLALALAGCESKQAKINRVEAEYDRINAQYRKDCLGMGGSNAAGVNEALMGAPSKEKAAPAMTPQQQDTCKEEKSKLDPLADELLQAQQQ